MNKDKMFLRVATYNIEFSQQREVIISNIDTMAKDGIMVFCLQEVARRGENFIIDDLLKKLGNTWQAIYHLGNEGFPFGMGTCILWNGKVLHLKKSKEILLPKKTRIAFHEWLFAKIIGGKGIPFQRRSIAACFQFGNYFIRISSIHLDHVGGVNHRQKQLNYFLSMLRDDSALDATYEIICGDFNSFDLLCSGKERQALHENFGEEYQDISQHVNWTADLYAMDMNNALKGIRLFIRTFSIHIRRKLDYIWVKNLKVIECKKLELFGSDHFPVIATVYIEQNL